MPARAREWTLVPYLFFPRNEGVPRFESGRRLLAICRVFACTGNTEAAFGYETGTSCDRFTVSEGVPFRGQKLATCRNFEAQDGMTALAGDARQCPCDDACAGRLRLAHGSVGVSHLAWCETRALRGSSRVSSRPLITIESSSSPQAEFGVIAMRAGRIKVTLAHGQ